MQLKSTRTLIVVLITVTFGLLASGTGAYLLFWADLQARHYNNGISHYRLYQPKKAEVAFQRSLAAYKVAQDRNWIGRFVYPKPDREMAALAAFQQGKTLVRMKNIPKAKKAFKESLRLNPGGDYHALPGYPENLSQEDITRLKAQAFVARYNLELLLKNVDEEAEQKGPGKKQEAKKEEEEKDRIPELAPGSKPGKGGKEDEI